MAMTTKDYQATRDAIDRALKLEAAKHGMNYHYAYASGRLEALCCDLVFGTAFEKKYARGQLRELEKVGRELIEAEVAAA